MNNYNDILSPLVRYFDAQAPCPDDSRVRRNKWIAEVLAQSRFKLDGDYRDNHPSLKEYGCIRIDYTITLYVPMHAVQQFAGSDVFQEIDRAMKHLWDDDGARYFFHVAAIIEADEESIGLNNCFFKQDNTLLHDELRFRSRGEVAIYDELKQRDILFFPNPAAVLGTSGGEYGEKVEKKEPDFLICFRGKWGILEINGDNYHSGIVKTTKDHERARRFNHYGVFFIQAYNVDTCKSDPAAVVDEFLKLLANNKA